jgi:hypothetical protein
MQAAAATKMSEIASVEVTTYQSAIRRAEAT